MVLSKPDEAGVALIIARARTVSGWAARKAFIAAGSGLPVAGSGFAAINWSVKLCGVFTAKTGMLFMPVRHSSPSGRLKRSAMLRTETGASGP